MPASSCRRPIGSKRSARSRPWSTRTGSSYSLDALCAWRGLPGKDTTLLRRGGRGRRLQDQQEEPATSAHLAIAGAPCRPLRRGRRGDHARAVREAQLRSSIAKGTRDAYRLDVDLLPMVHEMRRRGIRIDQSAAEQARDLLPAETRRRARRAVGTARHARQHGRNRVAKVEGANLRRPRHQLSAHREGQSVIHGRQNRLDGARIRTGCRS